MEQGENVDNQHISHFSTVLYNLSKPSFMNSVFANAYNLTQSKTVPSGYELNENYGY